jgi:hypothetical protein
MAHGYLGEFDVDLSQSPFKDYTPADWAMYFVGSYGQIDGDHHKAWVLDQVARILKGTPVIVKQARWDRGGGDTEEDFRVQTGEPSKAYLDWVEEMLGDEVDGEREYDYETGIAP